MTTEETRAVLAGAVRILDREGYVVMGRMLGAAIDELEQLRALTGKSGAVTAESMRLRKVPVTGRPDLFNVVIITGPGEQDFESFVSMVTEARADCVLETVVRLHWLAAENQRLTAERDEALKLAYIGEHRFPDLTWKARCEEAHQRATAAESALPALRERCAAAVCRGCAAGLPLVDGTHRDAHPQFRQPTAHGFRTWERGYICTVDSIARIACDAAAIRAIPIEAKT